MTTRFFSKRHVVQANGVTYIVFDVLSYNIVDNCECRKLISFTLMELDLCPLLDLSQVAEVPGEVPPHYLKL